MSAAASPFVFLFETKITLIVKLDVNSSPIANHYIFRRLLNVKGGFEQDKTPVSFQNHNHQRLDDTDTMQLPDPRYLALHAAIGGVLVKSGCVFYVIRLFDQFNKTRTLATDGSSNLVHLFASHSIGKVSTWPSVRSVLYVVSFEPATYDPLS